MCQTGNCCQKYENQESNGKITHGNLSLLLRPAIHQNPCQPDLDGDFPGARFAPDTHCVSVPTICYNHSMPAIRNFLDKYRLETTSADVLHLQAIGAAFSHLPYENVTKILKESRSAGSINKLRMAGEVLEDHLLWNTGGTCFSLCNALLAVLESCEYSARIAMADMRYGTNIHCAVVVTLQGGQYLLDPGYLLNVPIRVPVEETETRVKTPMNLTILRREDPGNYSLYTRERDGEKWRYRIRTAAVSREEFQRHWIHSFSLNTMEHVMMSRLSDCGRLYFRKNRLDEVSAEERKQIRIMPEDSGRLADVFGIPSDMILQARNALLARTS